jgi:hypothetical protein
MDVFGAQKCQADSWISRVLQVSKPTLPKFSLKVIYFPNTPLSNFIAIPQKVFVINSASRAVSL